MTEESSPYEQDIRIAHLVFEARIDFESFSRRFRTLTVPKQARILRACNLYEKTTRQSPRDADVAMALLCSAVESTQDSSAIMIFKDWIVRNNLQALEMKNATELRGLLNALYREYLTAEDREGASYNFRRFLMNHCPAQLQSPPIQTSPRGGTLRQATFEESIRYIYSRFRSLFMHEGIGRLERRDSSTTIIYSGLADTYNGNSYSMDMREILEWFSEVVAESLWNFFSSDGA
jgi:hypothetical protein